MGKLESKQPKEPDLLQTQPLAVVEQAPLERYDPTPMQLMDRAIAKGATPGDLQTLYQLKRDIDADNAKAQFNAAYVALQAEMEPVRKTVQAGDPTGKHWSFAPIEKIMHTLKPLLVKHGFGITFNSDTVNGVLTSSCTLLHKGGHSQTNKFAAAVGEGPPKSTTLQKAGSADTFAKRYALCDALGIVLQGLDNDAQAIGPAMPQDKAEALRQRLEAIMQKPGDAQAFVEWLGGTGTDFETIPENAYGRADAFLKKKESGA